MQKNIQNFVISYWFKKLSYNPKEKIDNLADSIKTIIDTPLLYNNEDVKRMIGMPRIEGISENKESFFSMSLINATLRCEIRNPLDEDEIVLMINNYSQLFYDVLKDIYDIDIIYTSIKLDVVIDNDNTIDFLANKFKLQEESYEDLSLKRGFIKDNYYINYILNSGKEYNFNVQKNDKSIDQDLFDQTMTISISEANLIKEYILAVIEVNDRYTFNQDANHRTKKDDIRGMILEIKDILKKDKYLEI